MKNEFNSKIKQHTKNLEKIQKQRKMWLYASSIVYCAIVLVIFGWDYLAEHTNRKMWWAVISFGLIVSMNWWYWTMQSLKTVVQSVFEEYEILYEVTTNIDDLKVLMKRYKENEPEDECKKCPYAEDK